MNTSFIRQQGAIFVLTLILLSLISVLLLTSMQHLVLYQRATVNQELQHQHFYQLEQVMDQLITDTTTWSRLSCFLDQDKANTVMSQLAQQGCTMTMNQEQYSYLIEDLGEYPCLVVAYPGVTHATHHFRVSLIHQEHDDFSRTLLQVRIIRLGEKTRCAAHRQLVALGVSSWRYLGAVK